MAALLITSVLCVLLVAIWVKKRREQFKVLSNNGIPGPEPASFFFGNLGKLHKDNVPAVSRWHAEFGDVWGYYLCTRPTVVVHDLELLKVIQVKDFHKFERRSEPVRGGIDPHRRYRSMLVAQHGQRWKEVRSILTPTFNAAKMKKSVPLIHDAIDALLENVSARSKEDKEFDIYQLFQGLTMDTIGRSAFGIRTDVQRNPDDPFLKAAQKIFADIVGRVAGLPFLLQMSFPEFSFVLFPLRLLTENVLGWLGHSPHKLLYAVSRDIVEKRRKRIADPSNPFSSSDLLQQMLEAEMSSEQLSSVSANAENLVADLNKNELKADIDSKSSGTKRTSCVGLTDDEIVSNSVLFFEAGYETTSTTLAFVAHVLVNHQDVQDKVREELNELFSRMGRFDYNTVTELRYMEAVINETLRLYPPVTFFITRVAACDYKYKDMTIPKGASINVPVNQLHRDPRHWDEPDKFDPERFMAGKVNPIAWQPFGAGPRNCIGMRFAMLEMKLSLARLLKGFQLVPGPRTELGELEYEYKPITMNPKNGIFVKAESLEGN